MKKLLLTLSLLLCAGVVAAQTTNPNKTSPTGTNNPDKTTDTTNPPRDAQGRVDKSSKFESVDTNSDSSLSQSEFDAAQLHNAKLAQIDKNGDGRISRDEWNSHESNQHSNPTDRR